MTINATTESGDQILINLRKLPIDDLHLLLADLKDSQKACLCIKPEGRTPEQVRELYHSLDSETQFEIWSQGMELNEANLAAYSARKKKLAESGGMNIDALIEKMVNQKLEGFMDSQLSSAVDTAGETSLEPTVPMIS